MNKKEKFISLLIDILIIEKEKKPSKKMAAFISRLKVLCEREAGL